MCIEQGVKQAYADSSDHAYTFNSSCHGNGWTQEERILGNRAGQGVAAHTQDTQGAEDQVCVLERDVMNVGLGQLGHVCAFEREKYSVR